MKPAFALVLMVAASSAHAESLPVPPIPPADPPPADAAPVPDQDARAPSIIASQSPSVALKFYRAPTYDPGVGFAPGSRYRSTEDRKPIQTPGLSISVPLQ